MPVKQLMTFGPCQETSFTAITLNLESSFTRREKNQSLFQHIRILDVKQEKRIDDYWNIDGLRDLSDPWTGFTRQVSLDLFSWKKTSRRIYVVRGEINEKTPDIQARSFMARTLGQNGKECQAEGEAKVVA